MPLTQEKCEPCRAGAPAATMDERNEWLKELPGWRIESDDGIPTLTKSFSFEDFAAALGFTHRLGQAAEEQDHHPSILLEWGKATVRWSTHKIKNLHRNDFVMAAKTEDIYKK